MLLFRLRPDKGILQYRLIASKGSIDKPRFLPRSPGRINEVEVWIVGLGSSGSDPWSSEANVKSVVKADEQEFDQIGEVRYLPVSGRTAMWSQVVVGGVLLSCLIVLGLSATGTDLPHELLNRSLILLSVLCFASLLLFYILRRFSSWFAFRIDADGLEFPVFFNADLLFRRRREWSDIGSVILGSMLSNNKRETFEDELEEAAEKKKLIIYFKSGGHASINLSHLSRDGAEKLFLALESSCMQFSRSPLQRLEEDEKKFKGSDQSKVQRDEPRNFTELWEQDMQDHFSATNFVPLKKGTVLRDGRFRILMQLASGGLSAVYLAETPSRELRIIKESVLPSTLGGEAVSKAKELFAREALLLTKLQHPRLSKVYDFFVENRRDYLILEFVPGQSITQLYRQSGRFEERRALEIIRDLALILDYLHELDPPVIHRDVTPDNIVIDEEGHVNLIDFGAANEFLGTATGTMVGKQAYISPEQFRGKAIGASDIYALGGSLYFMLTGQDPEPLSTSHPSELNSDVSPSTDKLVSDCTALESKDRIASASELVGRIEELLRTSPVEEEGVIIDVSGHSREAE